MSADAPSLVPFDARHADDVLDVIGTVFAEYGMTFDPDDFDADLRDIAGQYLERGGTFAVLVVGERVIGTVAAVPRSEATCEIKRVYLLPECRGKGYGRALMEHILGWAVERGYREAIAWSDVRLETAHRMYERLGFEVFGERTVEDIDRSREYGFRLPLGERSSATAESRQGRTVT